MLNVLLLSENKTSMATANSRKKTLFLVRHSESVNNMDKRQFKQRWGREGILSCKIPPASSLKQVGRLLSIPMDSPLSPNGKTMIEIQRKMFEDNNFVEKNDVQLIFHSHLQRARTTCQDLFKTMVENRNKTESPPIQIKEHPELYEKAIAEKVGIRNMKDRIQRVCLGLLEEPEERILLVGHSSFFLALLGPGESNRVRLENCEVWTTVLNADLSCTQTTVLHKGGHVLLSAEAD
jgi:broad specificity phosphatase PhoE